MWILDFLLRRPQRVRVNGCSSSAVCISTGSPQGCVLSPLLFILYTNDCTCCRENVFFVKISDDAAMVNLLLGDRADHRPVISDVVIWCAESYLCLSVSKTNKIFFPLILGNKAFNRSPLSFRMKLLTILSILE